MYVKAPISVFEPSVKYYQEFLVEKKAGDKTELTTFYKLLENYCNANKC